MRTRVKEREGTKFVKIYINNTTILEVEDTSVANRNIPSVAKHTIKVMWGRFVPNHYPLITLGESGDHLFLEDTSIYGVTMTSNITTFETGWAGPDEGYFASSSLKYSASCPRFIDLSRCHFQ